MNLSDEIKQIQALIDNIELKNTNTIRAAMNTSKANNKLAALKNKGEIMEEERYY